MRYTFNAAGVRFLDERGHAVDRETIRLEVDRALRVAGDRALKISEDLKNGRIDLMTWRQRMRDVIKETHLYSAATAKGGWTQMTPADYGRVGQLLAHGPRGGRGQYEYLEGFAREIANGLPLDGRFTQRTRMYAEAARTTFHNFDGRLHEELGFDEERSIRHADDSCTGCIEAEALGWQAIDTLPPIGTRTCLANCRCTMEFRKSAEAKRKLPPRPREPERALRSASERIVQLAEDLGAGRIGLATWRREMSDIIRETGLF